MIRMYSISSGMVFLVSLFLFCTGDKVAGTAGSETVNTFALVVTDQNNRTVSGASVRLVSGHSWLSKVANNQNTVLFSDISSKNGIIEIPTELFTKGDFNICANSGTIGAFIPSYQSSYTDTETSDTIILASTAQLSGTVTSDETLPSKVSLQGTDLTADVDPATGNYSFATIPAGDYQVIAIIDSNLFTGAGSVTLSEGADVHSSLRADFTGILVDDFETGSNLMSYFGSGDWYIAKDGDITVNFPTDREEPDTTHIPYESALVTDDAWNGKSLYVNYLAGIDSYFYLIIGAKVSSYEVGFSTIDTISFRAKGNGRMTVRLHGEENSDKPQVYAYIDLDTTWQQYTVTSDMYEIADPSDQSATWSDVEGRMQWLSFMPGSDGTDFWLDDVRLEGVTMRDLIIQ